MWVTPNVNGLKPSYSTKKYSDDQKRGNLCKIVSGDNDPNSILVHNDIAVYASLLGKGEQVKHQFGQDRMGYIHLCQTGGSLTINGVVLKEGDGAFIRGVQQLEIIGTSDTTAEFLLFDINSKS